MVKFIGNDLIANGPDPLTGRTPSETERFREVVANAVLYEQLGFDGFSVGERHHPRSCPAHRRSCSATSPPGPRRSGCSPA
jgi:alkanesulfonate monooxygenase SsuD/methylene tetrahydromethanopterin reductase-like flavin-dependent oxidoreductase (luciferase family)